MVAKLLALCPSNVSGSALTTKTSSPPRRGVSPEPGAAWAAGLAAGWAAGWAAGAAGAQASSPSAAEPRAALRRKTRRLTRRVADWIGRGLTGPLLAVALMARR